MMSIFICSIDTNVLFEESEYYLKFKGHNLKYVPKAREGSQDDLLLEMDRRMDGETAYELIVEFLSVLSFSLDAEFEMGNSSIIEGQGLALEKVQSSCAGKRRIAAWDSKKHFIPIKQISDHAQLGRIKLFRIAKTARPVYAQFLFWWHCVAYGEAKDMITAEKIDQYYSDDSYQKVDDILKEKILLKEEKHMTVGKYIFECARHAVAHIERSPDKSGKSLDVDSLKELRHFSSINAVLEKYAKSVIENLAEDADEEYFSVQSMK